jgi:hypothetical protein
VNDRTNEQTAKETWTRGRDARPQPAGVIRRVGRGATLALVPCRLIDVTLPQSPLRTAQPRGAQQCSPGKYSLRWSASEADAPTLEVGAMLSWLVLLLALLLELPGQKVGQLMHRGCDAQR